MQLVIPDNRYHIDIISDYPNSTETGVDAIAFTLL